MGRLNFILACFSYFITFNAKAQTDSTINLSEQKFIQGSFTDFYVDNLGNIYLLNTDNQIKKLNDKDLIETYTAALKIDKMAKDFIELLREELMNRSLLTKVVS